MAGLIRNRRGDIPITILVIGVFAVCALAILSFIYASVSLRNSFVGIDIVKDINYQIEFREFQGEDSSYFYQEINKTNYLPWTKDEILFSIEYRRP